MTDSARQALVEWCRARQREAQAHIAKGNNVAGAMLGASDAMHEWILIEGEQSEQTIQSIRKREDPSR